MFLGPNLRIIFSFCSKFNDHDWLIFRKILINGLIPKWKVTDSVCSVRHIYWRVCPKTPKKFFRNFITAPQIFLWFFEVFGSAYFEAPSIFHSSWLLSTKLTQHVWGSLKCARVKKIFTHHVSGRQIWQFCLSERKIGHFKGELVESKCWWKCIFSTLFAEKYA